MAVYRDEAVVLRTQRLGEADRIVSLLTSRHGRVRAVAKGVRRTKSKFGARLEPGTHVDLQLYEGRSLDIVTQAETLAPYGAPIADDYGRHTASSAVLETAERLSAEEREPALRLYLLLVGAMRTLADRSHDAPLVVDAFLLRALAAGGYEMALARLRAVRSGAGASGVHRALMVQAGGVVCSDCRGAGFDLMSEPGGTPAQRARRGRLGLRRRQRAADPAGGQRGRRRPSAVASRAGTAFAGAGRGPVSRRHASRSGRPSRIPQGRRCPSCRAIWFPSTSRW